MHNNKNAKINRKWILIWVMLNLVVGSFAENQDDLDSIHAITVQKADSLKAVAINKEAENPNFIHAYIMDVTPGKAFYSTFGHEAIRMECPSKKLDYCFSFEMDMVTSSNFDVLRRTAKAGFIMKPTQTFIESYRKERRGITAYELNLTPKEKQELWKFLDKSVSQGSIWTFDYLSVNCMSMMFYAISSSILPEEISYKKLPAITNLSFSEWQDSITRQSPWVNLLLHTTLITADGSNMKQEDKIVPEILKDVLTQATITDKNGHTRPLIKGMPKTLLQQEYQNEPLWFRPWMAAVLLILVITGSVILRKRKHKNRK